MSQSDIPSQSDPARRSTVNPFGGVGVVPQSSAPAGSTPSPGFVVSTYDARPPNSFDFLDINPLIPFPFTLPKIGARKTLIVPNDYVAIIQKIKLSLNIAYAATPPYAPPVGGLNAYLNNINGFANDASNFAPRLDIYLNDVATQYSLISNSNFVGRDYTFQIYLAAGPNDVIVFEVSGVKTISSLYTPNFDTSILDVSGTLIPYSGITPQDHSLNNNPIPVST